jgi:hypothetical protein
MSTFDSVDYKQRLVDLLPSQFENNQELKAILESIGTEMNTAQEEALSLVGLFSIATATGAILDVVGGNVGVKRKGSDDDSYRKRIQIEVAKNVSKGTSSDLINIARTYSDSQLIEFFEYGALGTLIQIKGGFGDQALVDVLNKAAPSGGSVFLNVDEDEYSFTPVEEGEQVSNTSGILTEVDESFDLLQTATSDVGNLVVNENNLVSKDDNLYYQGALVEYAVIVIAGVEYYDIIYAGTASDTFPAPVEVYYKED